MTGFKSFHMQHNVKNWEKNITNGKKKHKLQ